MYPYYDPQARLNLTSDETYRQLPIMTGKGPLVIQWLERMFNTIEKARAEYPRLIGIRCDLRYPQDRYLSPEAFTNQVMLDFMKSLRGKIDWDLEIKNRHCRILKTCRVRYVWAKEYGVDGRPHYHVLLLLNRDVYHTLGSFSSANANTFNRINDAWGNALGYWGEEIPPGLVHFNGTRGVMDIKGNRDRSGLENLFYVSSYLCKIATKQLGNREHCFETSRV